MKKYGVDRIWSWSRFNTYHTSPYEYYLKYIKHAPEDRQDCIYVVTGGMAHDIMEKLYTNQITYDEMINEFEDAWMAASIAELKFDRNDSGKNKKISDKYYANLKHFFNHHNKFKQKLDIERFVTVMIGNNLFHGYIDACFKDEDGNYNILDWKTSSIYKGEKALNECGQLVVYAIALHQLGVPYEKIKICWNFLKYVRVESEQAKGGWKTSEIERCVLGEKLQTKAKMWLKKLGYEERIMEYLDKLAQTNDISCLPNGVQAKFKISDCLVYVDVTSELIDKWTSNIIDTIKEIEKKEKEYEELKLKDPINAEQIFFDDPEHVKKESYYFSTLCAYSPSLHKPYKLYLDEIEKIKGGIDLLDTKSEKNLQTKEDDMSWLDLL